MQNKPNAQSDDYKKAMEALDRVLNGESDEEFLKDTKFIGEALKKEIEVREKNTAAKAINLKGIKASQEFEGFMKGNFPEIKHFERFYDKYSNEICYDVILPRFSLENMYSEGIMQKLADILREASGIDVSTEKENPEFEGMIYIDVSFPTIFRV